MDYQDYLKNGDWKQYSVRSYPEETKPWLGIADLAILALGTAIGYWIGHYLIAFIAAICTVLYLHSLVHPMRCPKCRGEVLTRIVDAEPGYRQFYHDCPKCRISWECERTVVSDS